MRRRQSSAPIFGNQSSATFVFTEFFEVRFRRRRGVFSDVVRFSCPPDRGARRAAWWGRRASAVEDRREVEPAEALGVGEYVDLDDLPAPDREAHNR